MKNNIRYVASILIEAASTIAINSGDQSLLLDNVLARDANGLPYIPGTSIAGVLHHLYQSTCGDNAAYEVFGCTQTDAKKKGGTGKEELGSRLIISSAHITKADGKTICDGLFNWKSDEYFKRMMLTPQRDHVKITDKGVGKKGNKFDRELLFKGVRFGFEIELVANDNDVDKARWNDLINLLENDLFKLGAGTRNGSGKIRVIGIHKSAYDLTEKSQLLEYLNKSSNLNNTHFAEIDLDATTLSQENIAYQVTLQPRDFIFFGSGHPDTDADGSPKEEQVIEWQDGNCMFKKKYLIPATSIKGALSHRTAFHYNRLHEKFMGTYNLIDEATYKMDKESALNKWTLESTANWASDDPRWEGIIADVESKSFSSFKEDEGSSIINRFEAKLKDLQKEEHTVEGVGENNLAVKHLFGCKKNSKREESGQIGRVLIEDIYLDTDKCKTHVFNHVKIDRFTGGAYDGALFQEKALYYEDAITLNIILDTNINEAQKEAFDLAKIAFEAALEDLKNGHLALGGATTKGYGTFQTQS